MARVGSAFSGSGRAGAGERSHNWFVVHTGITILAPLFTGGQMFRLPLCTCTACLGLGDTGVIGLPSVSLDMSHRTNAKATTCITLSSLISRILKLGIIEVSTLEQSVPYREKQRHDNRKDRISRKAAWRMSLSSLLHTTVCPK